MEHPSEMESDFTGQARKNTEERGPWLTGRLSAMALIFYIRAIPCSSVGGAGHWALIVSDIRNGLVFMLDVTGNRLYPDNR